MKICEIQIAIVLLLIPLVASLLALSFGRLDFTEAIFSTIIGEAFIVALAYLIFRRPILDIRKLVEEYEQLQKKRDYLKSLNDYVFKRWRNVSVDFDRFNVEIKMEDEIDQDLLEQGKDFLKSRNDETREILELWNELEHSKEEHNRIGKRIRNKIVEHISKAYDSLESKEARFVKATDNCYIPDTIIEFVDFYLKRAFLENKTLNWDKILRVEYYGDVENWILAGCGKHIQSKKKNDVSKKSFRNSMKKLKPKTLSDLKQLESVSRNIVEKLEEFKKKMKHLSNLIDLSLIYR